MFRLHILLHIYSYIDSRMIQAAMSEGSHLLLSILREVREVWRPLVRPVTDAVSDMPVWHAYMHTCIRYACGWVCVGKHEGVGEEWLEKNPQKTQGCNEEEKNVCLLMDTHALAKCSTLTYIYILYGGRLARKKMKCRNDHLSRAHNLWEPLQVLIGSEKYFRVWNCSASLSASVHRPVKGKGKGECQGGLKWLTLTFSVVSAQNWEF